MASKGPRSKLDHESRAKRQKALEAPKEPPRPKTHWDHVLEEMAWLSKDFEAERKWKMSLAKRVAIRATKSFSETRGEKKLKGEEQRMRKVALNISKDVKKFWTKIEKLVLYKYQLEAEERKKKALDKQLNYLLGQTERYSTMLAENLVSSHADNLANQPSTSAKLHDLSNQPSTSTKSHDLTNQPSTSTKFHDLEQPSCSNKLEDLTNQPSTSNKLEDLEQPNKEEDLEDNVEIYNDIELEELDKMDSDDEYQNLSDEEEEDDERTIEEDEAKITEKERKDELFALNAEADLPLEQILKAYKSNKTSRESSPEFSSDTDEPPTKKHKSINDHGQENGIINHSTKPLKDVYLETENTCEGKNVNKHEEVEINGDSSCIDQQDDTDYEASDAEEKDDEATLSEEEELAKKENANNANEVDLLQKESEMSIEELLARYKKDLESNGCLSPQQTQQNLPDPNQNQEKDENPTENQQEDENQEKDENTTEKDENPTGNQQKDENQEKDENTTEKDESTIENAAAAARSAQPTGSTFSTTRVRTKHPFLLKFPLREYQHIGLDWLVTMYEKRLNGILADEMGLGKTIMTIALLAHLAIEKGMWGPHLIVVPTSVMLNWETEFLKWCPAFKILTYFGSAKERKMKRQGWMKANSFHVCITTYRLVIQDSKAFKRKKWKYLILDEAHLIKNWKSQRWQTLLNFNSKRRILLTGTPLQNDLMELWSLMHFLMPHVFQSHQEFKDWFCNPISGMVDGQEKVNKEVIDRLHNVLRPFLLRRLKRDVEKQLPKKYEHVVYCRLSRRQRNLYEDFIASSETQATLNSSNFFGMISVIMQLRKVCNHPDLFEGRPIISSFDMDCIEEKVSGKVCEILEFGPFEKVDLEGLNLVFSQNEFGMCSWESGLVGEIGCEPSCSVKKRVRGQNGNSIFERVQREILEEREREMKEREESIAWWNRLRCEKKPVFGTDLREIVKIKHPVYDILEKKNNPIYYLTYSSKLANIILSPIERFNQMVDIIESFMFAIPASRAPKPNIWCTKWRSPVFLSPNYIQKCTDIFSPLFTPIRPAIVRTQMYFPDRRLIQFDCGKLQELSILLRKLKKGGHRALIFTQMTKMLDVLEEFINLYGYTYLRLDGSTPPEQRQTLMQRFNTNPKFFLFILSTRSGGVGINLIGADSVIFYDSDWNPAMDQQAQDRCHRIGQTREVHIYRLISESTIEENILKKANQKRQLDDLVIQGGGYNTEFFKKLDPMELLLGDKKETSSGGANNLNNSNLGNLNNSNLGNLNSNDVEMALKNAEDEADYMALKKVELEEDLDNQEFTNEVLEEDELVNDEEKNNNSNINNEDVGMNKEITVDEVGNDENALGLVEEIDMLADVRQLAEKARAAGQTGWSFENQLRPIDRYAMRFLDMWDPVVNKNAMEEQAEAEEEEWELDRIERMKEEMENEIDEDQEPLLYERWDADVATEAYRQHVEALTQQKLMEEMEYQAQLAKEQEEYEKNLSNIGEGQVSAQKSKSKKKQKKKTKKFKSLKKGKLTSKTEIYCSESEPDDYIDDLNSESEPESNYNSDSPPQQLPPIKKRKLPIIPLEEEQNVAKIAKTSKKKLKLSFTPPNSNLPPNKRPLLENMQINPKSVTKPIIKPKNKSFPSVTISNFVPNKNVIIVKPEKMKKKGGLTKVDHWLPQEDAVLCATVKEFGANWGLVSELVHGGPGSGRFRGIWRNPVCCCERFRELFFKHVLSGIENSNNNNNINNNNIEKVNSVGGKAVLKVTEDQIRALLNITSNVPDKELLLQKHFMAILSSVWRYKSYNTENTPKNLNLINPNPNSSPSQNLNLTQMSKKPRNNYNLVMKALMSANNSDRTEKLAQEQQLALSDNNNSNNNNNNSNNNNNNNRERMDLILGFMKESFESEEFPLAVSVSIFGNSNNINNETVNFNEEAPAGKSKLSPECSKRVAEAQFRVASKACFEGEGPQWATSSAFPQNRYKSGTKSSKSKTLKNNSDPNEGLTKSLIKLSPVKPLVDNLEMDNNNDNIGFIMDALNEDNGFEFVQHEYDPSFIEGLEEMDLVSDFSDIG